MIPDFHFRRLKKMKLSRRVVTSDQQRKGSHVLPSVKVSNMKKD